jgi:hypothetical protein
VEWLSDNSSIPHRLQTIEIALALNLVPRFTPVKSPESNGMAKALENIQARLCRDQSNTQSFLPSPPLTIG